MSLTTQPGPPAGAAAPAGAVSPAPPPGAASPDRWQRLRHRLARTPGRLVLATVLAVVAALALGLAGFLAGDGQARALDAARDDAAQLVGVQELRNDLVSADATATNAFLVGGLEPPEQRAAYEESLAAGAQAVPALAGAQPADADALSGVADAVQRYAGLVESARANNRQGFPVGSAYLDQASTTLRADTLPTLDDLAAASADRVADDLGTVSGARGWLVLVVAGLVLLLLVQGWLARRTHRVLNVGLATGTVVAFVGAVAVGVAVVGGASSARAVADGPYAATVAASQALASATDAKSMESFTLIKRGSGQAYEESFVASTDAAASGLDDAADAADAGGTDSSAGSAAALLGTWVAAHQQVRALDDGGDWDGAVALATSTGEGTPNAAFDAFADQARADVDAASQEVSDRLGRASTTASVTAWLALVTGVLAAGLAVAGVSARLKEYR